MLPSSDTNISTWEKEDIELLEQALEKALQVRSASGVSEKGPNRNKHPGPGKEPGATSVLIKDVTQSSAQCKGSQTTIRFTSKSASLDRKLHKKPRSSTLGSSPSAGCNPGQPNPKNNRSRIQNHPVSSVCHQAATKSQKGGSTYASLAHISTLHSKKTTVQSNSDDDVETVATTVSSPSDDSGTYSHTNESGVHGLLQQNGYVFKTTRV